MRRTFRKKVRPLILESVVALGLLLVGCSFPFSMDAKVTPTVFPSIDAPLTASIDGKKLVVTNNSDETIYHLVFPTDILPAIEWAPCIAPETCPPDNKIDPGQEKRIALKGIVREQTESITVFWWIYLEKLPGASVPPLNMEEIIVPLP